ncbi:hypothetical protein ACFSTE_01510 [Aquimarina hainanensis]|uniref:Uncharacterized protein n=1 Tax=Aquimarina hainanensis TaxID=1578017 RepID=A0ABW5N3N1_9FLAO
MRNQVEFYQSLGKLFYAVAASDKNVRAAEKAFLKEFINTQWTLLEDSTDEFYTAAAFQIEIVFDWYEENGVTSEESLTSFKTFKHNNPSYSTPGINDCKTIILEKSSIFTQN